GRAAGRAARAACVRLQAAVEDLGELHPHGHWLPALKLACALLGLGTGLPAAPLASPTEGERAAIRAVLIRHALLPDPAASAVSGSGRRPDHVRTAPGPR